MDINLNPSDSVNCVLNVLNDKDFKCPCTMGSDLVSDFQDTVHYLSPASTPRTGKSAARTEHEGDQYDLLDYQKIVTYPFYDGEMEHLSLTSESSVECIEPTIQRTLTILKPDAMVYKDVVLRKIIDSGLDIIAQRTIHLTPEQAAEMNAKHYGSPAFPHMVISMCTGPSLVLAIQGYNVVSKWRQMTQPSGTLKRQWFFPFSVRLRFGLLSGIHDSLYRAMNLKEAEKANRYFYSESILEPIIDEEEKVTDFCGLHVNPTLSKGLAELLKTRPIDPILFLAEWLLLHNPFQPRLPQEVCLAPIRTIL